MAEVSVPTTRTHKGEKNMTTTKTFSPDEVSAYLRDPIVTDDHDLGDIKVCLRVIGSHAADDPDRDPDMVEAAMQNIAEWAEDFGVDVDFEVIAR